MTPPVPPVPQDQLGQPIYIDQAHGITPDTSANLTRDVPVCSSRDVQRSRLWVGPAGTQLMATSMYPTNDLAAMDAASQSRMQDINQALWQQIVGARGDFLYSAQLQSGRFATFFQPVCREANPASGLATDPNARYRLYYADMPELLNPPGSPALLPVNNFVFQPSEIAALANGVPIPPNNYGVDPSNPHVMSIMPDAALLERIRDFINSSNSPIAADRRGPMSAAFANENYGAVRTAEGMRTEMRWTMAGMGLMQLFTTAIAMGKGASLLSALLLFPRMVTMPIVDTVMNAVRLARGQSLNWSLTRGAYGDARRMLTTGGRHRATLDRMTVDAAENARQFLDRFNHERPRALEEIRRAHPGLSEQDLADRARGAARDGLRGQFPDYVAADEMLHSIELGLRSSDPEERADAQARLDRITDAERTLVQAKNSNPVFIDIKGTGKSIRMYSIVLRSLRGESSVPPDELQRRNWRELSRRGLMGTGEGDSAKYVGNLETNVQKLVDAIDYLHRHGEPVGLLVDEIHSFFGNKDVDPHVMKALQLLKNRMAKDNMIAMLGATTPSEYAEVTTDAAMADRLRPIRFPPTNPATLRLAIEARLLTVNPDALSGPNAETTIARLIESSFQLEGEHSPRRILDIALPSILAQGNFTPEGVDQYFRSEKEMRINELVRTVVQRFEPVARQARLLNALQPGSSGGSMSDADLRQQVVRAVLEVSGEKGWAALVDAEDKRIVTEAFNQARAVLDPSPTGARPVPVAPTAAAPGAPAAPRPAAPPRSPWMEVALTTVNDRAVFDALSRVDPSLAAYYRSHISPATNPVTRMNDLITRVALLTPEAPNAAIAGLPAGTPMGGVMERSIFELIAGSAERAGAWREADAVRRSGATVRFEAEARSGRNRIVGPAVADRPEGNREAERGRGRGRGPADAADGRARAPRGR